MPLTPTASPHGPPTLTFTARELLPPSSLRGTGYEVEPEVRVVGGWFVFTIRTPDGSIEAVGRDVLDQRLLEMSAIERAKRMAREPQELLGVVDSFEKTGRGIEALITDPGEAIKSVPKGIGRKLKSLGDKSSRRAGGETRRNFAAAVGCDPETRNPVLRRLLDELSLRRSIGEGAVGAAAFGATGGAALALRGSSALRTTGEMQGLLRSTPLYKINSTIRQDLTDLGIAPELAARFAEHENYTTLERLLFMKQFRPLASLPGSEALVRLALGGEREAQALGLIRAMGTLNAIQARRPLAELSAMHIPLARLQQGASLGVDPADYIMDGARLRSVMDELHRMSDDSGVLIVAGALAPAATEVLSAAGVRTLTIAELEKLPR